MSSTPTKTEPTAYAAAINEKLPTPRSSDSRTNCGTPTIHVPDEIVTPTPTVAIATASAGWGAVKAEDEGRDAVGEPNREYAQRSRRDERDPHQRDVVERIAEDAHLDREVRAAKVGPAQQRNRPVGRGKTFGVRFGGNGRDRIGDEPILPSGQS